MTFELAVWLNEVLRKRQLVPPHDRKEVAKQLGVGLF